MFPGCFSPRPSGLGHRSEIQHSVSLPGSIALADLATWPGILDRSFPCLIR